jgi:hypothetical protein
LIFASVVRTEFSGAAHGFYPYWVVLHSSDLELAAQQRRHVMHQPLVSGGVEFLAELGLDSSTDNLSPPGLDPPLNFSLGKLSLAGVPCGTPAASGPHH